MHVKDDLIEFGNLIKEELIAQDNTSLTILKQVRYQVYKKWVHDYATNYDGSHQPLPSCIEIKIKETWPNKIDNYVGFIPSDK